jgi:hypothetical protein
MKIAQILINILGISIIGFVEFIGWIMLLGEISKFDDPNYNNTGHHSFTYDLVVSVIVFVSLDFALTITLLVLLIRTQRVKLTEIAKEEFNQMSSV